MLRTKRRRGSGFGKLFGKMVSALLFGGAGARAVSQSRRSRASSDDDWPPGFHQELVGESNYQRHLRAVGGRSRVWLIVGAELVPEPENIHDENAVRVDIKGGVAGYLPRLDAKRYRKRHGAERQQCQAFLVGSRGKNIGVWIDFRL